MAMSRAAEARSPILLAFAGAAALLAAASCAPQVKPQRVDEAASLSPTGAHGATAEPRSRSILPRGHLALAPAAPPAAKDPAEGLMADLLAKGAPPGEPPAPIAPKERSGPLPSGFYNPMPGGVFAGYRADTGLDIAGSPRPVYAIAAGWLDYSEPGHTLWTGPKDTANCVRWRLETPIRWKKGRQITHVYYAHLSRLEYVQAEGSPKRQRIEAGEKLGISGTANHSPHLHIGLLLDGEVEQYAGTFLFEDEVREVLGGYRNGTRLPREIPAAPTPAQPPSSP